LRNAQINHGLEDFFMTEEDLEVVENEFKAQTSDCVDDRHFTLHDFVWRRPHHTCQEKVAMALAELITKKYPKDTLDIFGFWR